MIPCGMPDEHGWSCCGYPNDCRRRKEGDAQSQPVTQITSPSRTNHSGGAK